MKVGENFGPEWHFHFKATVKSSVKDTAKGSSHGKVGSMLQARRRVM